MKKENACPFCNSTNLIIEFNNGEAGILCLECGAMGESMAICPDPEICCKCFEYIEIIQTIQEAKKDNIALRLVYLDTRRSELHDEICKGLGIDKEKTYEITNNAHKMDGGELYDKLLDLSIKED